MGNQSVSPVVAGIIVVIVVVIVALVGWKVLGPRTSAKMDPAEYMRQHPELQQQMKARELQKQGIDPGTMRRTGAPPNAAPPGGGAFR